MDSVKLRGIKAWVFDAYGTLFDVSGIARGAQMKPAYQLAYPVVAAVLLFATSVHAADDVQAALSDMQRASVTPQIVTEFCARQYPIYAETLRAAFDAWRRKHADLIFEIETRADGISRRAAGGDEAKYVEQTGREKASMSQYRASYEADLRRLPPAQSEPACAKYGADLTHGEINVSDLEKTFAAQLKLIRQGDPASDSK